MSTRLAASLLLLTGALSASAADSEPEDALKSVVVLNFLRYSTWPDGNGPLRVGVVGRASLLPPFRELLEGKSVNGRAIHVIEVNGAADPRCCHVLYIATDNVTRMRKSLAGTRAAHVLTIGESDRFLDNGGAVNLMLVDGHMSFEVSLDALEGAAIRISSRLLHLGQVRGKSTG